MEIRLRVEDGYVEEIMKELGAKKPTAVVLDAIGFYKWAISERKKGRFILSTNEDGSDVHKIVMPSLEKIASHK